MRLNRDARLRRGEASDLHALLEIRSHRPMPESKETRHGGFLLGSEPAQYGAYLAGGHVQVLERGSEVVAFCVAFPDEVLRASELWSRIQEISWSSPEWRDPLLESKTAFIDQLASRPEPGHRFWTTALALWVIDSLSLGHRYCVTTTVLEPVSNRAAWSFLTRAAAVEVGQIDEHYPQVGRIRSAIVAMDCGELTERLAPLRLRLFGRGEVG